MKTQQIDQQRRELEEKLQQLENDRIQAERAERDAKLDQIAGHVENADAYRSQAAKANNDEEKRNCYRYAAIEEEQANELRKELGLSVPEPEPEPEPIDTTADERNRAMLSVNSLLLTAFCTAVAYMITGYSSTQIEAGILSFLLNTAAHITYSVALVCGVLWVALRLVLRFVPDYLPTDLRNDFTGLSPAGRVGLLAGFVGLIVYVLTSTAHVQ